MNLFDGELWGRTIKYKKGGFKRMLTDGEIFDFFSRHSYAGVWDFLYPNDRMVQELIDNGMSAEDAEKSRQRAKELSKEILGELYPSTGGGFVEGKVLRSPVRDANQWCELHNFYRERVKDRREPRPFM
jgi:hypothetical protein